MVREGSTSESRATVDLDGHFHTRPVPTLQLEGVDTLWFFTDRDSPLHHSVDHPH
jgi:general stress protein 26